MRRELSIPSIIGLKRILGRQPRDGFGPAATMKSERVHHCMWFGCNYRGLESARDNALVDLVADGTRYVWRN